MKFIAVFTQDRSCVESLNYIENKSGGAVTMRAVADVLKKEVKKEGAKVNENRKLLE